MKEKIQKLLGLRGMMIIKLKQVFKSMNGDWDSRSIRVNSNQIQYYYPDSVYRNDSHWKLTNIVFNDTSILVTQTLEEIDLILNEDMRVQRYEQPVL